jgi:hypothetical protein
LPYYLLLYFFLKENTKNQVFKKLKAIKNNRIITNKKQVFTTKTLIKLKVRLNTAGQYGQTA